MKIQSIIVCALVCLLSNGCEEPAVLNSNSALKTDIETDNLTTKSENNIKTVSVTEENLHSFCEVSLGDNDILPEVILSQKTIETEDEPFTKYKAKLCKNGILTEINFFGSVVGINIIDSKYCKKDVCIGQSYEQVSENLPHKKRLFTLADGGLLTLYDETNVSYIFDTSKIPLACFQRTEACDEEISKSKLVGIYIVSKN